MTARTSYIINTQAGWLKIFSLVLAWSSPSDLQLERTHQRRCRAASTRCVVDQADRLDWGQLELQDLGFEPRLQNKKTRQETELMIHSQTYQLGKSLQAKPRGARKIKFCSLILTYFRKYWTSRLSCFREKLAKIITREKKTKSAKLKTRICKKTIHGLLCSESRAWW